MHDATQHIIGAAQAPMMGVLQRMIAQNPGAAAAAMHPAHWSAAVTHQGAQTVQAPKEDQDMLPMRELNNNGVLDSTHPVLEFQALPQRPFRGERFIVTAFTNIAGQDPYDPLFITGLPVVGVAPIASSPGRFPLRAFRENAFDILLTFPSAGQGTIIDVQVGTLLALGAGQTISVVLGIFGKAVR
jgi:hypothetical protein